MTLIIPSVIRLAFLATIAVGNVASFPAASEVEEEGVPPLSAVSTNHAATSRGTTMLSHANDETHDSSKINNDDDDDTQFHLAPTPPMGWMSWERYRCETNCTKSPKGCINSDLYERMADHLATDGYLDAGYNTVHIDDCWMTKSRDVSSKRQVADPDRFPEGIDGLATYVHGRGVRLGLYTDIGTLTCGGYPGTLGYETIDAITYGEWGVDYLKVDGCYASKQNYTRDYPKLGRELSARKTGRNITYSCSWPAYMGSNETSKDYPAMIQARCNLWRNYGDIDNKWESVSEIINHYGDYSVVLAKYAAPGHWNDMDMILAGNDHLNPPGKPVLTLDQSKVQLAIWAIMASPLIMSNDLRTVPVEYRDVLIHDEMIAVHQDILGKAGQRIVSKKDDGAQVWARPLKGGKMAVVLYNPNKEKELHIHADVKKITNKIFGESWEEGKYFSIRNVWDKKDVGTVQDLGTHVVGPTSALFFVVTPVKLVEESEVITSTE